MLWGLAGVFLLYWTYDDLRCGMISEKSCLIAAGTGTAARILFREKAPADFAGWGYRAVFSDCVQSLIPGMFVMGIAVVSGERIGKGDAWMLFALGALMGTKSCMRLFVTALAAALLIALIQHLAGYRKNKNKMIPFASCLMIAYILCSIRI